MKTLNQNKKIENKILKSIGKWEEYALKKPTILYINPDIKLNKEFKNKLNKENIVLSKNKKIKLFMLGNYKIDCKAFNKKHISCKGLKVLNCVNCKFYKKD